MADKAYVPQNPYQEQGVDPKYQQTTYNVGSAYRTIIPEQFKNAIPQYLMRTITNLRATFYTVPKGYKFLLCRASLSITYDNGFVGFGNVGELTTKNTSLMLRLYVPPAQAGTNSEVFEPASLLVFNEGDIFDVESTSPFLVSVASLFGYIIPSADCNF